MEAPGELNDLPSQMVCPGLNSIARGTRETNGPVDYPTNHIMSMMGPREVNDVPEPIKDGAQTVPLPGLKPSGKEKAKGHLYPIGGLIELVLRKVPETIDGNPVKAIFSIAESVLELKKVYCVMEFQRQESDIRPAGHVR
jgi:hypothetical protein